MKNFELKRVDIEKELSLEDELSAWGFREQYLYINQSEIESQRRSLAYDLASLSERLLEIAHRVNDAKFLPGDYNPLNPLGEIQGRGLDIDRKIAVLSTLHESRNKGEELIKRHRVYPIRDEA